MDKSEIQEELLRGISLRQNTKKLFVIGLVGLSGSGKSYIAKAISNEIDIPITSNDQIRRYFNKLGVKGEAPLQMLLQELAEERTETLLMNSVSHIIDADLYMFADEASKRVESFGGKLILINVVADEKVIIERIGQREFDSDNMSKASLVQYQQRKKLYKEQNKKFTFYFEINNSLNDIQYQIAELTQMLIEDGFI